MKRDMISKFSAFFALLALIVMIGLIVVLNFTSAGSTTKADAVESEISGSEAFQSEINKEQDFVQNSIDESKNIGVTLSQNEVSSTVSNEARFSGNNTLSVITKDPSGSLVTDENDETSMSDENNESVIMDGEADEQVDETDKPNSYELTYLDNEIDSITQAGVSGYLQRTAGNTPIKSVEVRINEDGEEVEQELTEAEISKLNNDESVEVNLTNLKSDTKYDIEIEANQELAVRTRIVTDRKYSDATISATKVGINGVELDLKNNHDLSGIEIKSAQGTKSFDLTSDMEQFVVTDLMPNVEYEVIAEYTYKQEPTYSDHETMIGKQALTFTTMDISELDELDFSYELTKISSNSAQLRITANNPLATNDKVITNTLDAMDEVRVKVNQKTIELLPSMVKSLKEEGSVVVDLDQLDSNSDFKVQLSTSYQSEKLPQNDKDICFMTNKEAPYVDEAKVLRIAANGFRLKINVIDKDKALETEPVVGIYEKNGGNLDKVGTVKIKKNGNVQIISGIDYGLGSVDIEKSNIYYAVEGTYNVDNTIPRSVTEILNYNDGLKAYANLRLATLNDELNIKTSFENSIGLDVTGTEARILLEVTDKLSRGLLLKDSLLETATKVVVSLKDIKSDNEFSYELTSQELVSIKNEEPVSVYFSGLDFETEYQINVEVYNKNGLIGNQLTSNSEKNLITDYHDFQSTLTITNVGYTSAIANVEMNNPNNIAIEEPRLEVTDILTEEVIQFESGNLKNLEPSTRYRAQLYAKYSLDNISYPSLHSEQTVGSAVEFTTKQLKKKPTVEILEGTNYDLSTGELILEYRVTDPQKTLLNDRVKIEVRIEGNVIKHVRDKVTYAKQQLSLGSISNISGKVLEIDVVGDYDLSENGEVDGSVLLEEAYTIKVPEVIIEDGDEYVGVDSCDSLLSTDNEVANGIKYSNEYNYILTDDVSCGDEVVLSNENYIEENNGIINGNNHTIAGVAINQVDRNNIGIVGTNNGTIKNIKLSNVEVSGYDNVGALVGTNNGIIDNVQIDYSNQVNANRSTDSSFDIVGLDNVGGIAGTNNGTILNSTFKNGSVIGETNVGGAEGYNGRDSTVEAQVTNAEIQGTFGVGGIVGWNNGWITSSSVESTCITGNENVGGVSGYSKDNVDASINNLIVSGDNAVGGFIGQSYGLLQDLVTDGATVVTGQRGVGGVVGYAMSGLRYSENNASVHGIGSASEDSNIGGVVGRSTVNIRGNVNNGDVTAPNLSEVGGIVGAVEGIDNIVERDPFSSNKNYGNVSGKNNVGGIAGSTDEDLLDYTGANYGNVSGKNNVGGIVGSNGYLYLETGEQPTVSITNYGRVSGDDAVGGIAGANYGTIEESFNAGRFVKGEVNVGGVIGMNYGTLNKASKTDKNPDGSLIIDVKVSGSDNVGGVVGNNNGLISHIVTDSQSTVTGEGNVGGLVGINGVADGWILGDTFEGLVEYSINNVNITGDTVGGIAGTNNAVISNNMNKQHLQIDGDVAGGIVGENNGTVSNNMNNQSVSNGGFITGGIVGVNNGILSGNKMENSCDTSDKRCVTAISGIGEVGGIVGVNNGEYSANNVSNITVEAEGMYENYGEVGGEQLSASVGGAIGENNSPITISPDESITNITVKGVDCIGGVVGQNNSSLSSESILALVDEVTLVGNHHLGENSSELVVNHIGGVVGQNKGTLLNINASNVEVSTESDYARSEIGGIAGNNTGEVLGEFSNSKLFVEEGKHLNSIGGIVGTNSGIVSAINSNNRVSVTSEQEGVIRNVGGVVGDNNGTIKYSAFRMGTITPVANETGTVPSIENIGGIAGKNNKEINNSYSVGSKIYGGMDGKNVGGVVGDNKKHIQNVYSTSYVEGYEYVGGIVGHQGKPGKIENTFFDDIEDNSCGNNSCYPIQNEENNISRGALEIVGQDRVTREVIEDFKNIDLERETIEEHYLSLDNHQRNIIDEAYRSDSQDWYISDTNIWGNVSKESLDNIVVLSNQEYDQYVQATSKTRGMAIEIGKWGLQKLLGQVVDEYAESPVDWASIKIQPYMEYNLEEYKHSGFYDDSIVNIYGFQANIWDYSTLTDESIGTYEPIKLKPLAEIA